MRIGRLAPVHRFTGAVSVLGGSLLLAVMAHAHHQLVRPGTGLAAAVLVPGVIIGELLPLKIPRRGDDEEITISTTFSFALLLASGLPAALLAQAVASLIQDVAGRKPAWRTAFNVGQYSLALCAAAGAIAIGSFGHLDTPFAIYQLPVVIAGAAVFFLVNFLVVGVAIALFQRARVIEYLRSDFTFSLYVSAVLLCLAPLLLLVIDDAPGLYAACLLPLLAVYHGARQAARAERQATRDALTGLANRPRLQSLIQRAIDARAESGTPFAVMLMDLDRFKEINDTLGHHHGDLLLQLVGERLQRTLRTGDVVGRLGGDEFVVIAGDVSPEQPASAVAERIDAGLREPFALEGLPVEVGASIGIATFPADGTDVATLLQHADIAMYHAKRQHLAYAGYATEHDHHSPAQLMLAADLRRAIEGDELEPHYQLLVDFDTQRIASVEALARWRHPSLGLLGPGAFIEVAESTGLIRNLTLRVLERALRERAEWAADDRDLAVAVNVSMRTLLDRSFPQLVADRLAGSGTAPDRLKLEITESTIMADPATVTAVLRELDAMGVTLAIDDFGTGYSSLAYLHQLPVREIKIDRSFVTGMAADPDSALIVRSTIDLGHNLGLRVIAEGVEDAVTLDQLRELGCDGVQGFHLARPHTAAQVAGAANVLEVQLFGARGPVRRLREVG
jgi:diguanylate cyclase (GGDEF)-like protein